MASTILLDQLSWDLVVDLNGNIAMASAPYALAQDAASAIKLFRGELWYDTTQGVKYYRAGAAYDGSILNEQPPLSVAKTEFNKAALTVPGVVAAQTFIASVIGRKLAGQVQITDKTGGLSAVRF